MGLLAQPGLAHVRSIESSGNSDIDTARTIAIMCRHIADAARDPLVCSAGVDAQRRFRGGPFPSNNPAISLASSDWWWCKHFVRFVHHETLIEIWLGEIGQLQLLIPPDFLVRLRELVGDCAVYSMLICAMLRCQGIDYELVTVATMPEEPAIFNHVYPRAVLGGGRLALDASHGDYPGWQVPSNNVFRLQAWNAQGMPIEDQGSRFAGLHGYRHGRSGLRGFRRGVAGIRLRGLGQSVDTSSFNFDDSTGMYTDPATGNMYNSGGHLVDPVTLLPINTPAYSAANVGTTPIVTSSTSPSASSAASPWTAFAANMASAWTKIAGNVIAPQVTLTRGPGGTLSYSAPAGSAAAGTTLGASLLGGSSLGGSSLLWIALAVVGVMVLSRASK